MRCSACGARNSDDAAWCTQCYADLRGEQAPMQLPDDLLGGTDLGEPERRAADVGEAAAPGSGGRPSVPADPDVPSAPRASAETGGHARDVRDRDGVIEWRCPACDGWTVLTSTSCDVCGTPRRGFGDPVAPTRRQELSGPAVLTASLLLPGLGHMLAGRAGTGIARAILAVLWLLGGLALVVGNPGIRALPGWVLVISAVVLWAMTAMDAQALASGRDQELLGPRRLGTLVLVVTVALVLSAGVVLLGRA